MMRYYFAYSGDYNTIRDQLMACHRAIMGVKITSPNDRPLLDIKYPKGYEG